jgi:hypothetical protein
MTQQTKQHGCHRGENRRVARAWSVAPSSVFSLPRIATGKDGVLAPSGPPG